MNLNERPYCILNTAMSIDGKIATIQGQIELSSEEDWKRVHRLRCEVDGILVGINTIISDDPKLRIKYFEKKSGKLYRIIVDSNLRIPLKSNVLNFEIEKYPTIIITTQNAPKEKEEKILDIDPDNIKIIRCGNGPRVDLKLMARNLKSLNINKILLEGGGTLNFSMLANKLVDEIRVAIAPYLIGGKNAITFIEGEGFINENEIIKANLIKKEMCGNCLVLYYRIKY